MVRGRWDNSLFGCCFDALWSGQISSRLLNALNTRVFLARPEQVQTLYLSNHDHSHAAWQAGARSNVGATQSWWRLQPFLIALYTATGVPLIHNGQEFAQDHFVPEDDKGSGRRVVGRPLQWKFSEDSIGRTMLALHRALGSLRSHHPAFRSPQMYPSVWEEWQTEFNPVGVGVDEARQLAVYHRWATLEDGGIENLVIVLNFDDGEHLVDTPFPTRGMWDDLLADFDGSGGTFTITVDGPRATVPVGPHWGRILWQLNPAAR